MPDRDKVVIDPRSVASALVEALGKKKRVKALLTLPYVRETFDLDGTSSMGTPDLQGGFSAKIPFRSVTRVPFVGNEAQIVVKPSLLANVLMTETAVATVGLEHNHYLPSGSAFGEYGMEPVPETNWLMALIQAGKESLFANSSSSQKTESGGVTTTAGSAFPAAGFRSQNGTFANSEMVGGIGDHQPGINVTAGDVAYITSSVLETTAANKIMYIRTWDGTVFTITTAAAVASDTLETSVTVPVGATHLTELGFMPAATATFYLRGLTMKLTRATGAIHTIKKELPLGGSNDDYLARIRSAGSKYRFSKLNATLKYTSGELYGGDISTFRAQTDTELYFESAFDDTESRVGSYTGKLNDGAHNVWYPATYESRQFSQDEGVGGSGGIVFNAVRGDSSQTCMLIVRGCVEVMTTKTSQSPTPMCTDLKQLQAVLMLASHLPAGFPNDTHIGDIIREIGKFVSAAGPLVGGVVGAIPGGQVPGAAIAAGGTLAGAAIQGVGAGIQKFQAKSKPPPKKRKK